jgi:hypothetical protein
MEPLEVMQVALPLSPVATAFRAGTTSCNACKEGNNVFKKAFLFLKNI